MAGRRANFERDRNRNSLTRRRRQKEQVARQERMAETLRQLDERLKEETKQQAEATA